MTAICIFHKNCLDGFAAAWVVREHFRKHEFPIEFHAGVYNQPPPDVTGRDVWIVDFSYKLPIMAQICKDAKGVIIIDHHKTAIEELENFDDFKLTKVFDLKRSGAGLTWDYLFANSSRPALIDHIEDRDLWQFKLPGTREIQAALFSYPYDFDIWDRLMKDSVADLAADGRAIERKHHKDIAELLVAGQRMGLIADFEVPICNLPYIHSNDAGHIMAKGYPFAACYWDSKNGTVFSLRSSGEPGSEDVSTIAQLYGGGGHRNAAGFTIPYGTLHQMPGLSLGGV